MSVITSDVLHIPKQSLTSAYKFFHSLKTILVVSMPYLSSGYSAYEVPLSPTSTVQ